MTLPANETEGSTAGARGKRIRVVWNPLAGSKAGIPTNRTSEEELRELMGRFGLGAELLPTESASEARALVDEAVQADYDVVVAAGGDGTVGEAAKQLLGKRPALGILPLGSAMNIARSLGIPRELEAAMRILATGDLRVIDTGIARTGHSGELDFFEAGSVGMNAAIFAEGQRIDEGKYDGLFNVLRVILRYRPRRMRIVLDEETIETRALMVTVANGPYTGMGFTFAPDARLDDGLFDVRVFRRFSRYEAVRHMLAIAAGRRAYHPKVTTHRSREVLVEARHPLPCRADAQDLGTTPVTFEIRPSSLRVIVPNAADSNPEERSALSQPRRSAVRP